MKTLTGLEWFGRHYKGNSFIFKVDTDVFVDIFKIIRYIKYYEYNWSESDFIFACINKEGKVFRVDDDYWGVSYDVYPNDTFPPYPGGKYDNL